MQETFIFQYDYHIGFGVPKQQQSCTVGLCAEGVGGMQTLLFLFDVKDTPFWLAFLQSATL